MWHEKLASNADTRTICVCNSEVCVLEASSIFQYTLSICVVEHNKVFH